MPSLQAELTAACNRLREDLTVAFAPSVPSVTELLDAPVPTLLLAFKNELAVFAVAGGDARKDYQQAYAFFRKLYERRHKEWDPLNLSFVLCLYSEERNAEIEALCRDIEGDVYFCRKFVIFLRGASSNNLLRLPFVPLKYDVAGFVRPASAQTELQSRGVPPALAEAIVVQHKRSADGILQDCLSGKYGGPKLIKQVAPTFREAASLGASNRLTGVEICNFRAYRTPETFDLDGDVVLLFGQNGLGKTSLYDAIDFCGTGGIGRLQVEDRALPGVARHLDSGTEPSYVTLTFQSPDNAKRTLTRSPDDHTEATLDGRSVSRKVALASLTGISASAGADRIENMVSLFRATHLFSQEFPILTDEFRKTSELSSEVISRLLAFEDFVNANKKVEAVEAEFEKWVNERKARAKGLTDNLAREKEALASLQGAQAVKQVPKILDTSIAELQAAFEAAKLPFGIKGRASADSMRALRAQVESERSLASARVERINGLLRLWPAVLPARTSIEMNAAVAKQKRAELAQCEQRLQAENEAVLAVKQQIEAAQKRLLDLQSRATNLAWWVEAVSEYRLVKQQFETANASLQSSTKAYGEGAVKLASFSDTVVQFERQLELARKEQEEQSQEVESIAGFLNQYDFWKQQRSTLDTLLSSIKNFETQLSDLQAKARATNLRRHEEQAAQQRVYTLGEASAGQQ